MKTNFLLTFSILVILFLATATLLADKGGNGKGRGYPNHGITSPGEPNHYASPGKWEHP